MIGRSRLSLSLPVLNSDWHPISGPPPTHLAPPSSLLLLMPAHSPAFSETVINLGEATAIQSATAYCVRLTAMTLKLDFSITRVANLPKLLKEHVDHSPRWSQKNSEQNLKHRKPYRPQLTSVFKAQQAEVQDK